MKNIMIITWTMITLSINSCNGQDKSLKLNSITFNSIFGVNKKDSTHIYCLLGTGFFRTPRAENSDNLLTSWILKHPNAEVKVISTLDETKEKITYCWLVDKQDTINNFLVRTGCFPGGTMMRPETYEEMSPKMKELYSDIDKPKIIVHVDKKTYNKFYRANKAS